VKASHPYKGEDEDELNFEKGEIILVIPYDDPDDEVYILFSLSYMYMLRCIAITHLRNHSFIHSLNQF